MQLPIRMLPAGALTGRSIGYGATVTIDFEVNWWGHITQPLAGYIDLTYCTINGR